MTHTETLLVNIGGTHEGHRGQYAELFSRIINSHETPLTMAAVFSRKPIVFSMIEESFTLYSTVSVLRSWLGRRTAGILFRPLPTVKAESWKLKMKRAVLAMLNRLPQVATLTIMPFDVEPQFAKIARGWFFDPQFWDLHFENDPATHVSDGKLAAAIKARAGNRQIVCAIGRQDKGKGFAQFLKLYGARPDLREKFLFVSCGKVVADLVPLIADFENCGGAVYNQFITDAEILDLYAISDLIWCCYDVQYDQASGIFGRAMQLGVPVILREKSLIHKFSDANGVKYIACAEPIEASDLSHIPEREPPAAGRARAGTMADVSIGTLRGLLGLPPRAPGAKGLVP